MSREARVSRRRGAPSYSSSGKPPIEVAGLRLHVERTGDQVALVDRRTPSTATSPTTSSRNEHRRRTPCSGARPLPFNAMVIAQGRTGDARRVRVARRHAALRDEGRDRSRSPPLSAWYLSSSRRRSSGIEDRDRARPSRRPDAGSRASPSMSQVVRSGHRTGRYRLAGSRRLLRPAPLPDLPVSLVISGI